MSSTIYRRPRYALFLYDFDVLPAQATLNYSEIGNISVARMGVGIYEFSNAQIRLNKCCVNSIPPNAHFIVDQGGTLLIVFVYVNVNGVLTLVAVDQATAAATDLLGTYTFKLDVF